MAGTRIVFVPLAGNQTAFYLGVAEALKAHGVDSGFLSFHEPSLPAIGQAGFAGDSVFAHALPAGQYTLARALEVVSQYGVVDVNLVISHERSAYELRNSEELVCRFASYLVAMDGLLTAMSRGAERLQVVQELGGFLPVAAAFYAARRLQIRNTFIEPSFFPGRVFLTHDSYAAPRPAAAARDPIPEMLNYLARAVEEKRIAIPEKDAPHYRSAARKIISARNLRRLVEKAIQKHAFGQQEEFDHLGGHVKRHLRMLRTARRLRRFYQGLPARPFVYYPFHVPADVALTIRAPEFCDQMALIEYLARVIPPTHLLAVKEHPALVGGLVYDRVADLLRRYDNVVLLRPTMNNYDVLSAADVVVTVNSKSGAEGVLLGRRVIVLGDAFYRAAGLVHVVERLQQLPVTIREALAGPAPSRTLVEQFFQSVWDSSWPGELYSTEAANCACFANSLARSLGIVSQEECAVTG